MVEPARDDSPLNAFLGQYWEDRDGSRVRSLDEYLAMFPGDAKGVAREYLRCEDNGASASDPAHGSDESTLGCYRLEQEIGRGGQAVVYRAHDTRIGRSVAVKVLRESRVGSAGADEVG